MQHILISIMAAIAGHLIIFNFFFNIFPNFYESNSLRLADHRRDKQIEITRIDQNTLNKLRTVGVKDGKKDFSAPINLPQAAPAAKPSNKLSVKDLGFNIQDNNLKKTADKMAKPSSTAGIKVFDPKVKKIKEQAKKERMLNNMIKREMIHDSQVAGKDVPILQSTDINMHFAPPEGVDTSELNSVEKKFFSFRKRSYKRYVNSFIKALNAQASKRPYIRELFNKESDLLTGKITFDAEGNIITIKILKWANNDYIQQVFDETLEGISALKNPPHEFIQKNGEFTVYYKLNIN